jgi:hypothetical protein
LSSEFKSEQEKLQLFWSLFQIEKVITEHKNLLRVENLTFLETIEVNNLTANNFLMFKQLVCLGQLFCLSE